MIQAVGDEETGERLREYLHRSIPHAAGLGLGLYLARVLAESLRIPWSLQALFGLLLATNALGLGLARFVTWEFKLDLIAGIEFRPSPEELAAQRARPPGLWPLLPLWLYVLWPFQHPALAWGAALVCLFAWLLTCQTKPGRLGLAIFVGALLVYVLTLSPGLQASDGGEFQLAAARFDLAHPPGYPLYSLLSACFAHLPLGPGPAWRLNLFSALIAAASLALVGCTAHRLAGSAVAGLLAALTLGSATTFWATATVASIRPPTVFFCALMLYALTTPQFACRFSRIACRISRPTFFAIALGLGLAHHASLLFIGAVFSGALVLLEPALLRQPRRWLAPLLALALTQVVWLYLPLRNPTGDLNTLKGFSDYALARGFRGDMFAFATPEHLPDRLALLPTLLRFQFNPLLLLAALLGGWMLLRRDWRWFVLLAAGLLVHTFVTLTYRAPQTVEYEMPAYMLLALLVGCAVDLDARLVDAEFSIYRIPIRQTLLAAVVLTAAVFNALAVWPNARALARQDDARTYAESLLAAAPPDAVILSNWHWATPLWYLQAVKGLRPDVLVEYVTPQGLSLAQNWLDAITRYAKERPTLVLRFFEHEYSSLPCRFEPLGLAFIVRNQASRDAPEHLTPLDVELGGQVKLLGYALDAPPATRLDQPIALTLAWTPSAPLAGDIAWFAHLLGPGGLAGQGLDRRHSSSSYAPGEVLVERFWLYPLSGVQPGDYALSVGAYQANAPGAPRLTGADGTDHVVLTEVSLLPAEFAAVSSRPQHVPFVGGPTLVGIDYDTSLAGQLRLYLHWRGRAGSGPLMTQIRQGEALLAQAQVNLLGGGAVSTVYDLPADAHGLQLVADRRVMGAWGLGRSSLRLPDLRSGERYVPIGGEMALMGVSREPRGALAPGDTLRYDLRLVAARPLLRDRIASVSLVGLEPDGAWAWRELHDSVPALGAVPTFKWVRGSSVLDRHRLSVPVDAPPGPVNATLLVYDHYTQAVLPPLDDRLLALGLSIPLDAWVLVERPAK